MSESNGEVHFTREFMRKLEKLLGADFKRDDFKIDANGCVASGRPLTARRIRAILSKATVAAIKADGEAGSVFTGRADAMAGTSDMDSDGETEGVFSRTERKGKSKVSSTTAKESTESTGKTGSAGMVSKLSKNGGVRKGEVYGPYAEKLATIQKEVAKADEHVVKFFKRVASTLDYLYDELDVERRDPNAPDPSGLRYDQEFEFRKELEEVGDDEPGKFEYYDNVENKFKPFKGDTFSKFLWDRLGGGLLHTERAHFSNGSSTSIEPLKKYIIDNARLFVMKAINTYFASKEAGKLDAFFNYLKSPGACIEQQCMNMIDFEAKNLTKANAVPAEDARAMNLIADGKSPGLPENTVNQFMMVIEDFEGEKWFSPKMGWNKEISDGVKAELRGKRCTMQNFDAPHNLGEAVPELIGDNGLPVVKVLTDELIDELGPKVLREYFRA